VTTDVAAVITEAAAGNMGVVPPTPEFEQALRSTTQENGALLISDEVMTGFRVTKQGWYGTSGMNGDPDLFTFGKVMGGGFPAAAFGGRADIMRKLAPEGPVYQAGTLSGNPVATAAGLATLNQLDDTVYQHLQKQADVISQRTSEELTKQGVAHVVQNAGSMFSIFFTENAEVRNYEEAKQQDLNAFTRFFHSMLSQGVYLPPSAFESWFLSAAHDDEAVEQVLRALPEAAAEAGKIQP
jgi:glutamate-1-semialdehyde 2,1-aminomutase